MRNAWITVMSAALFWCCAEGSALARPQRGDFALSIERFMGVDFTGWEGPRDSDVTARLLLNASEPVPTSLARTGFDFFLSRLSLGIGGGFTSEDLVVLAPRVGYMLGLSRSFALWLRAGFFFVARGGPDYFGFGGEALFHLFLTPSVSLHFGPTLDIGLTDSPALDFIDVGIPQFGLSVWF